MSKSKSLLFILLLAVTAMITACDSKPNDASGNASVDPKAAAAPQKAGLSVLNLHISDDGTAIVDAQGDTIARFVDGIKVTMAGGTKAAANEPLSIPGCMCCTDDCLIYENGKCIKTYRNCTWDFDCNCPKD